jgi:hypothetical protein
VVMVVLFSLAKFQKVFSFAISFPSKMDCHFRRTSSSNSKPLLLLWFACEAACCCCCCDPVAITHGSFLWGTADLLHGVFCSKVSLFPLSARHASLCFVPKITHPISHFTPKP